jgi:hypothetical protein
MGLRAMKIVFKIIITLFMINIGALVFSGSIWDGSVSTARYGYLPQTGMYAASNAFPQNSKVTVTNPGTGKTVDVVILERLEDNNLFLVLSTEAAESIGIGYGEIFYGNISEQVSTNSLKEEELAYNPDPDINPSASSGDYSELSLIQDYIDNELGGADDTLISSETTDPDRIIPEPAITEILEDPEIVENVISEEIAVEDSEVIEIQEEEIEDSVPEVDTVIIPVPEIIEEDTPSIENMPMEEVYISESNNNLPSPEIIETVSEPTLPESVEVEEIIEEDLPVTAGMTTDVPVMVEPAELKGVLPELPVPESDIPVITLMDSGIVDETDSGIDSVVLPELPIITISEPVEEEIPLAVAMTADILPLEQLKDDNPLLPEIIAIKDDDDPISEILLSQEPDKDLEVILEETDPEIINPEQDLVTPVELDDVEVVLEPSDPRPPIIPDTPIIPDDVVALEPEVAVVITEELPEVIEPISVTPEEIIVSEEVIIPETGSYDVTRVLAEDSYYLQLGVYREQYSALDLAGRLGVTYPVTVLVSEIRDTLNYKVMVGPLGQDESGAVLYSFKSTGYPDAFLRKGL